MIFVAIACAVGMIVGSATDLSVYLQAARELTDGGWSAAYDPAAATPFKYQPTTILFFLPLAWLPWPVAKVVWALVNGAAVWDAQRRLVRSGVAGRGATMIAAALVVHGLTWQFKLANVTFLMLWLLVIVATGRRRETMAAAAGFLVVAKPIWLILLPVFLLRGDFRRLGLAAATVIILSAAPFAAGPASGAAAYRAWAATLGDPQHAHNYPKNDNQSIMGVVSRRLAPPPDGGPPTDRSPLVWWAVLSAVVAIPWLIATRRIRDEERWRWATLTAVPVMLWIGPLSWIHHQILLWPLCAMLIQRRSPAVSWALGGAWLLLNGTGELFLGRSGFVWAAQAGLPILAFPLLLAAAIAVDLKRTTPRHESGALQPASVEPRTTTSAAWPASPPSSPSASSPSSAWRQPPRSGP